MNSDMKPWRDEAGHMLGWVRRNGSGVRQLMLLRNAVDLSASAPAEVDVMAVVEGGPVFEVKCSICENVRTWYPDSEQMERLVEKVLKFRAKVEGSKV